MKETYDVVVGIPSYNESKTIGYVTHIAGRGLAKYFPDAGNVIVNVDNNSPDDTKGAFLCQRPYLLGLYYMGNGR